MKKILITIISILSLQNMYGQCNQLFFSEYVEGAGNNKALEIYNPTNNPINLSNYWIKRFGNGATDATLGGVTQLSGIIQPHSTFIIVNGQTTSATNSPACDPALQSLILSPNNGMLDGLFPAPCYFNGNDALTLEYGISSANTTILDIFGVIGQDPINAWTNIPPYIDAVGATWITANHTLIRKSTVQQGVTNNPTSFNALAEYDTLANGTWTNLGTHICNCPINTCNLSVVNQPQNLSLLSGSTAQFTVSASGTCSYQWQTNIGFGFQNLSNAGQYSGTNQSTLSISNISAINNGQIFRCIISQGVCADTSNQAVLSITTCNINLVGQPQNVAEVVGNSAQFVVNANTSANYQWQTNIGFGFQNLSNAGQYSGANQSTLTVSNLTLTNNNQTFRCILSLNSCVDTTNIATLAVTTPVGISKIKNAQDGIYPNPSSDFIYVDYTQLAINKVELIDIYGNIVLSSNLENGNRINISALAKGIYFIKLGDKNEFKKIIKK